MDGTNFRELLVLALLTGFFAGVGTSMILGIGLAVSRSRRKPLRREADPPLAEEIDLAELWKHGIRPDGSQVDES